jgi:hypothetical protein
MTHTYVLADVMDDKVDVHNCVWSLLQARECFIHAEAWKAITFPFPNLCYVASISMERE